MGPVVPLGLLSTLLVALASRYADARRRLFDDLHDRAERTDREQRLLAAEMHDVVSHRVSLMVLQAGALEVTAADEGTRSSAQALRGAGIQALDALRELVGVLRAEPSTSGSPVLGPAAPAPGVAELVDASRAAGLEVALTVDGDSTGVPPALARAAHRVVQEALTNVHKHAPGSSVAADGAEAVEAVVNHRPDVVLMDLRMPGVDGITAIARIAELPDPPAVVALTTFDGDEHVQRAMQAGAAGYLLKSTPPADLVGLVRVAADGHTVMTRSAARRLVGSTADRGGARTRLAVLTEREREVVGLLGEGLTNTEIGKRLYITEATVKGYVSRALDKLGCTNRTQLGLLARDATG